MTVVTQFLLRTAVLGTFAALVSAQETPSPIDGTRSTMERWVETRSVIGKEKRDWALGREILNDRIGIVQREIESVQKRIEDAKKSTADADSKKQELATENQRLVSAAAGLSSTIGELETRTRTLLQRLPDPLRERVKLLSQRIPEDAATTKMSLSERFLNVVGVLNEVNKFQREVTVTSEVRKLADGSSAEVTAVYVGIGQGYYTTANGKSAGIGNATATGWEWTPNNAAAPQIQKIIAILKNEIPAEFVPVPVKVQ
jgi:archaellum component FlaC